MANVIYGATELDMAIRNASGRTIERRVAQDMLTDAWNRAGYKGVNDLLSEYGINGMLGHPTMSGTYYEAYSIGEIAGATEVSSPVLYKEVLDVAIDSQTDDVVFETAKQVATKSGSKIFSAGAIKTATSALNIIGAVATGVELGWESYKAHPDFWTDLNQSIFNSSDPNTPVEVLARAHAGKYTTAYKEKEACRILQELANQGAFDYYTYESEIPSTVVGEVEMDVTFTSVAPSGRACALAMGEALSRYGGEVVFLLDDWTTTDAHDREVIRANVFTYSGTLPTRATVYSEITEQGTITHKAHLGHVNSVEIYYYPDTEQYFFYYATDTGIFVYSGYDIRSTPTGNQTWLGGLNIDKELVLADNELFPNNHASTNLQIAPNTPIENIIGQLREKFPAWYDESWLQPEYDPETGTVHNERYYPVTTPYWDSTENPNKDPSYTPEIARRGDSYQEPDPRTEPQGKENTKGNERVFTDPQTAPEVPIVTPTDTPTDTGGGAGATSTSLWSVYNPTMNELNDLGAYLWTNNIVELLEKFLQNPMDAIISLHKVYCTPPTGSPQHIALGYLDSGVSSKVVTNQFVTVDCGSVVVPEYFEDARDYDIPYTNVECYLPFVGIVKLKTQDIIGGKVNVVYTVDLYSGACICKIFVTKLGAKQLLYCFSGNCSMQIPLTGADRTRMLSGAITGAVTGAFAGAQVGAVVGAVAGAFMGGTSIDRTSQFSANAGCMGVKKPYLILTRKYSYDAGFYQQYYGYPSNVTVSLSSCKGYTRVKSMHIESILRATDGEKKEIESLLKEGVIIK